MDNYDLKELLDHFSDQILDLDLNDAMELLPEVEDLMREGPPGREWERAVVTFFLINGLRVKRQLYCQHKRQGEAGQSGKDRRHLRLVK